MTFYLPGIVEAFNLNIYFIDLLKEHPEYFNPEISIGAVYGTFNGAIWNGGRVMKGPINYDIVAPTIEAYNSRNIGIRYTWTNPCLQSIHLGNPYCNYIMELSNNSLNEVIVNTPVLEEYIRQKYQNVSFISSTTKCLTNKQDILSELDKDYKLVVLDFRKNTDFEFLSSIQNKDKIELLINAYCGPNCGSRKEHYYQMGLAQLGLPFEEKNLQCDFTGDFCLAIARPTFIKKDDLFNKYYKELGFSHFKMEGRSLQYNEHIYNYLYYLIQPQYYDKIMIDCVNKGAHILYANN